MKKIPNFKKTEDEIKFWGNEDSTDYIDWDKAASAKFTNLKPSTETISLRLPASLLSEIKNLAHKRDVPYQSLVKLMLAREASIMKQL